MSDLRRVSALVVLLFATLTAQGCVPLVLGAAAGAGGMSYIKGSVEKNIEHSIEDIHEATLKALKKLDIFVLDDDITRHEATFKAEYPNGKKVEVVVEALTERSSKIKVRVGILGDQDKGVTILNAILRHL